MSSSPLLAESPFLAASLTSGWKVTIFLLVFDVLELVEAVLCDELILQEFFLF